MYRLLIVDSDSGNLEKTKYLLDWSVYGFELVMTASSYAEALNTSLDLKPHVALVSFRLGQHHGYKLAEQLRSIGIKCAVCILSDTKDPEAILAAMRAGVRDYLTQPLSQEEMHQFLERIVVNELGGRPLTGDTLNNEIDPVLHVPYTTLSRITNKIILVVKSSYRTPQTLTGIADSFHMSSKYLGRIFLKDTGIKFSEYLMAYRMLEARKLILSTQEKISVIANMVGYVQQNNFYAHFRNYFGVSPSALRNFEAPQDTDEINAI